MVILIRKKPEKKVVRLTCISAQRSHCTSPAPIAINILDKHVMRWTLHSNTFVLIRGFNVMNVNVATPDIHGI